jgi:hypothetical protein
MNYFVIAIMSRYVESAAPSLPFELLGSGLQ